MSEQRKAPPKQLRWHQAIADVRPHIVKISTPQGSGTGFECAMSQSGTLMGIATAAHVIDHAHYWQEPIRIDHHDSGSSVLLHQDDRAIIFDEPQDTAFIIIPRSTLKELPETTPLLHEEDSHLRLGVGVGWLGFPAISPNDLCFFSGNISCRQGGSARYLIDGVAINGVSGGPVIHTPSEGGFRIIGIISAYIPNRTTGISMPGLCVAQDVSRLHESIKQFATLTAAKTAESEQAIVPPDVQKAEPEKQG